MFSRKSTIDRTIPQAGQKLSSSQMRTLFDQAGDDIDLIWQVLGNKSRPEDYGAIGDGQSHPARVALQVSTLAELRAYKGGIFAHADSIENEMDWLAWQAALYNGGVIVARSSAPYVLNKMLVNPNGYTVVEGNNCSLIFSDQPEVVDDGSNLLVNGDLEAGSTGWENTLLDNSKDLVFTGGKAVFTDPTIVAVLTGADNSFGAIGQQVTIPPGRWTCKMRVRLLTTGATAGYFGPPYAIMRFTPFGIGFGGYEWPSPFAVGATAGPEFDGWLSVDIEVKETTTTWFMIQGGNCDWEVLEARISPWLPNFAVWFNGDFDIPSLTRIDASLWENVRIYGPATQWQYGYQGPAVDGILHKGFMRDVRCNLNNINIRRFRRGEVISDNAYLMIHNSVTIGYCAECVYFQDSAKNAGEQLRYTDSILFNSGLAINAEGGAEWNFTNSSIDYCTQLVSARKGAVLNFTNHHWEFSPPETRIYVSGIVAPFQPGKIMTGGTSGATAKVLQYRAWDPNYVVIEVLSGTFVSGEALTDTGGGSAVAAGGVQWAPYQFDLRGGCVWTMPSGEYLQAGFSHQGARHAAYLESNLDQMVFGDVWGYNWSTATGDWATGSGRVAFGRHLGPGNSLMPDMMLRNGQMDAFGNQGGVRGTGTGIWEDQEIQSPVPANIGLDFAARSNEASGAAINRGLIPWEQSVTGVTSVFRTAGKGSIKMEYNPVYTGDCELQLFLPVTPGKIVLFDFYYSKPDSKPTINHGPYVSGLPAAGDTIYVNTTQTQSLVTIEDKHIPSIPFPGPQAGWKVTLSGVTGNPGGIPNAVWNATHTIVQRLNAPNRFTIDLGVGNVASSSVANAGGAAIQATYEQTNVNIYIRQYWTQSLGRDNVGRHWIGGRHYQGERQILLNFAAQSWTRWKIGTWYAEPGKANFPDPRVSNGRAPDWATHWALVINWGNIKVMDPAAPPPFYLADFYANVL